MKTTLSDDQLAAQIRATLTAVADTAERAPSKRRATRRARRIVAGVVGASIVAGATLAAVSFGSGEEYVDRLPPDHVIASGEVGRDQYWLVESFHHGRCGNRIPGVELVVESRNLRGQEWSTTGDTYGDLDPEACHVDTTGWLSDPARWRAGGQLVDGTMLVTVSAHPDVTAIRVTMDGRTTVHPAYPQDGARYAIFEVPPDVHAYTLSVMIGDDVVPRSTLTREVRRRP